MKIAIRHLTLAAGFLAATAGVGMSEAYAGDTRSPGDTPPDGELELVLNVPTNRLLVYEDGEHTRTYKVSIGLPGYETPPGEYNIRNVIWNPWWHPPDSEWAQGREIESPGPANPMGRIKLYFAPLLYIHGTVETASLGRPASRGCVRMRNDDLIELTRLIHSYASPKVSPELIDRLEASHTETRTIGLDRAVKFTAHYSIAAVNDGFLVIYPDVYGLLDEQVRVEVENVLREHGVDPRRVHRPTFERLLAKSGSRRVAISLDDLRNGSPGVEAPSLVTPDHDTDRDLEPVARP